MKTQPKITDFNTLLDFEHGKIGTETRSKFEEQSQRFIVSEMLKSARKEANMTQEELAEKVGTKKSYISKLENGKVNVRLSTLIQIFEEGLNRRVGLTFL
jgi:DNA-binding XRE family transcriptional regulator